MPGIIIPFVFSEQMPLISRTSPLKNELAGAQKPFEDAFDRLRFKIRAANLPRGAGSDLLALEKPGLNQPLDCAVAHAA